jgi:hypothetical protein
MPEDLDDPAFNSQVDIFLLGKVRTDSASLSSEG